MNLVDYIDIDLENCEVIRVPIESFVSYSFTLSEDEEHIDNGKLVLKDLNKLLYLENHYKLTPQDRLLLFKDVMKINIKYLNKEELSLWVNWKEPDGIDCDYNRNQENILKDGTLTISFN